MNKSRKKLAIIIMAAGDSTRFSTSMQNSALSFTKKHNIPTKKQWLRFGTKPLWLIVLESITNKIAKKCQEIESFTLSEIIITASSKDKRYMEKLVPSTINIESKDIPIYIVEGGNTRYKSLLNAVNRVDSDFVLVNDAARFNVKDSVIDRLFAALDSDKYDCIAPYLPVSDTALLHDDGIKHIKRENLKLIQTPQISKTKILKDSANLDKDFSDETSLVAAMCKDKASEKIALVLGDKATNKLTTLDDIYLLESINYDNDNNLLIGHGCDIHGFVDSKEMYLCGVNIESSFGFKAHSDGDVGIHAIIDSILGAMNYGDIGELFPDNDNAYKGIDSKILLKEVYDYCLSTGLEIANLDVTIIAQTPRISPYKAAMKECLARILYLDIAQISIKATTAENLGFVGRKEGVYVECTALLKSRAIKRSK